MVRPFTFIKKFPATFTEFCKFAKLLSINTRRHPVFSSRNTIARNGEFYILKKEITRTKFEQNSRNLLAILRNQRNFLLSKIHFLFNRSVNFLSIEINFALVRFTNPSVCRINLLRKKQIYESLRNLSTLLARKIPP